MKSAALLLLAVLATQSVAAQPALPTWRDITVYASDASYPEALARRGVQGDVTLALTLDDKGRKAAVAVRDSSRSAELDALAVAMVKRLDFSPLNGARSGLVTIAFRKDHSNALAAKTCADFNADAAYQSATFPERTVRELPVFYQSIGKLIYSFQREGEARTFPSSNDVLDMTVAGCARTPGAGMLDVMRQEVLKLLDR